MTNEQYQQLIDDLALGLCSAILLVDTQRQLDSLTSMLDAADATVLAFFPTRTELVN
jgi:hypothetical protein